jgi:hypothetical protein
VRKSDGGKVTRPVEPPTAAPTASSTGAAPATADSNSDVEIGTACVIVRNGPSTGC